MKKLKRKFIINVAVLFVMVYMTSGFNINNVLAVLGAGLILTGLNMVVKPILKALTLPITILTLGLFGFVINAFIIMLTDLLVPSINLGGYIEYIAAALVIWVLNIIFKALKK